MLGSRGSSTISGPELASLLGLQSTWAYFSVANGKHVTREPDRSHLQRASTPTTPAPAPAAPATPTGGPVVAAPTAGATSVGATGGASAG